MHSLPVFDIAVILVYLNSEQFIRASGRIPGWAIGLSIVFCKIRHTGITSFSTNANPVYSCIIHFLGF